MGSELVVVRPERLVRGIWSGPVDSHSQFFRWPRVSARVVGPRTPPSRLVTRYIVGFLCPEPLAGLQTLDGYAAEALVSDAGEPRPESELVVLLTAALERSRIPSQPGDSERRAGPHWYRHR